jgi:hypothetical protein
LVHFYGFGIVHQEKSGNPGSESGARTESFGVTLATRQSSCTKLKGFEIWEDDGYSATGGGLKKIAQNDAPHIFSQNRSLPFSCEMIRPRKYFATFVIF